MAALSWPSVLLVSTVGTLILARIASLYSVNFSYISLFLATFTSSIILGFLYDAVFYPRLLSPLRKLPQPTVSFFYSLAEKKENHQRRLLKIQGELIFYGTIWADP